MKRSYDGGERVMDKYCVKRIINKIIQSTFTIDSAVSDEVDTFIPATTETTTEMTVITFKKYSPLNELF